MVVAEVRRRRKAAEGGRRRRKSTDIKSNNPHLAGGEKQLIPKSLFERDSPIFCACLESGGPPLVK